MKQDPRPSEQPLQTVFAARKLLTQGLSLQQAAEALHVQKRDLDYSLWLWIHAKTPS